MSGPYFPGQLRDPCGCYFPDNIRVRDVIEGEHTFRVLDCINCGERRIPIHRGAYGGPETWTPKDKLEGVREAARERLRLRNGAG